MVRYRVEFKSIPWVSQTEGMRQRSYRAGSRQLRLVEYSKDMPPHWCEKGHFGYVLDGRIEIKFDKEVHTYFPGDGIFLPSGQAHRHVARALTDTVTVIFVEDI